LTKICIVFSGSADEAREEVEEKLLERMMAVLGRRVRRLTCWRKLTALEGCYWSLGLDWQWAAGGWIRGVGQDGKLSNTKR
jgi:hypothetical protein